MTFWQLSSYSLTNESAWVIISLNRIISLVMRSKNIRFSATCKINRVASENLQDFIFCLQNYANNLQKSAYFHLILWVNLKDITAADKI